MTADIANQKSLTGPSTMLYTLALTFTALTLFFALLSMLFGSRISTLQTRFLQVEKKTATSEAAAIQEIGTELKSATLDLKNAQQALNKEKAAAEGIRRKLAVVTKNLANTKADLDSANKTIIKLKSALPSQSSASVETNLSQDPSLENSQRQTQPSMPPPGSAQVPAKKTELPVPPAVDPEKQIDRMASPADTPLSSADGNTVTEETIADSPQPLKKGAPAAE